MAAEEGDDFYSVLGLKKECSEADLKTAYKKLAMRWHPDRCSASGNSKYVEEAKKKFQAIQEAYSVLSDANKRLLYDVGVYDPDDDDNNGMGDFLNEMAAMMSQNKSTENVEQSFEELKMLFDDMFQSDIEGIGSSSFHCGSATSFTSSTFATYEEIPNASNKRNFEMNVRESDVATSSNFDTHFQGFCFGAEDLESQVGGGKGKSSRRSGRKQKVSSGHDVSSSNNTGISAS